LVPAFEKSVFINCPFDKNFEPILQAMAFCVVLLGFVPRLAPENADNAAPRLARILQIVKESKYGIHDLSRCKAVAVGEYYRMNMPFELGVDHASCRFGGGKLAAKAILVLEHTRYDFQKALSDISGWDIEAHGGDWERALSSVRNWLVAKAGAEKIGPAAIKGKYTDFQEWYYERALASGASEDDIREYPTTEVIQAMHEWVDAGKPAGFN
jgi:hypothetical protein